MNLFFYLLPWTRYKAKRVKTHCFLDGVGQIQPRFQGEGVVSREYFLVSRKLDILLSDSANCTVLRIVVLTQYRRVTDRQTDGQTDGIAVASTAACNASIATRCKHIEPFACRRHRRPRPTILAMYGEYGGSVPFLRLSNFLRFDKWFRH